MTLLFKSAKIKKHCKAKKKKGRPIAGKRFNIINYIKILSEKDRKGQAVGLNKKQDEGALDNYLEVPLLANHNKNNTVEDVSSYANKTQREFLLLLFNITQTLLQVQYFKLKSQ